MEIIAFYLIIGVVISIFIYVIADIKHWIILPLMFIAWLPLFFISMILSLFIDVRSILQSDWDKEMKAIHPQTTVPHVYLSPIVLI